MELKFNLDKLVLEAQVRVDEQINKQVKADQHEIAKSFGELHRDFTKRMDDLIDQK